MLRPDIACAKRIYTQSSICPFELSRCQLFIILFSSPWYNSNVKMPVSSAMSFLHYSNINIFIFFCMNNCCFSSFLHVTGYGNSSWDRWWLKFYYIFFVSMTFSLMNNRNRILYFEGVSLVMIPLVFVVHFKNEFHRT